MIEDTDQTTKAGVPPFIDIASRVPGALGIAVIMVSILQIDDKNTRFVGVLVGIALMAIARVLQYLIKVQHQGS